MHCENCGTMDADNMVILGVASKLATGALNTIVCLACAQKSPHYCNKHAIAKDGYSDGTTACRLCAAESANDPQESKRIWGSITGRYKSLHAVDFNWLPDHIVITIDARMGMFSASFQEAFQGTLILFVATKALRLGLTITQLVDRSSSLEELLS